MKWINGEYIKKKTYTSIHFSFNFWVINANIYFTIKLHSVAYRFAYWFLSFFCPKIKTAHVNNIINNLDWSYWLNTNIGECHWHEHLCEHAPSLLHDVHDSRSLGERGGGVGAVVGGCSKYCAKGNVWCAVKIFFFFPVFPFFSFQLGPGSRPLEMLSWKDIF